jgi:mono/diheme cytochrome c family protein
VALLCLLLPACQQEMADQPSYHKPLQPSDFFPDGRSARPIPAGTVPRGRPLEGSPMLGGDRTANDDLGRALLAVTAGGLGVLAPLVPALAPAPFAATEYTTAFPFPIDEAGMARGQQRYTIFCAVCHGTTGKGDGKIVERGYLRPPDYALDDSRGFDRRGIRLPLRDAPVGYLFTVVTRGFGGMPSYAEQVPAEDRWKIVAYVRALQLSRYAPLESLSPTERQKVQQELGKQP